jgi:cytochrome P450
LAPLLSAGIELVNKSLLPLLEQVQQLPDAEGAFDKNYLPEALEKVVRLEASIDARISKVLARLVALKEFKRTPAGNPLAQLTASRSLASGGLGSG